MDDIQFSEFLDESIPLWRNDPVMFFREVLNFEPDEWQAEAARDLAANPKVSIKSGQGVGKTGLEAAVFLWFITCFPYPRIVATAPTKQQLHDVLWSEISKWMSKVYVQIDDTGLGGGVTDRLKEVRKEQKLYKMQIIPINAAEKIETDTAAGKDAAEKYNNLTTAMWASMRDLLDNKQIVIEDDEQTVGQLSSRKYTMTSNGKLEIESKKEMKKRGLDSPDRADALALALYLGKIKKHTGTAPGVKELQELTKDNYWG